MIRCPYCRSLDVAPLPLGDYLCLTCGEQFSKGERPPRHYSQNAVQKVSGKVLFVLIKKGPELLKKAGTIIKKK